MRNENPRRGNGTGLAFCRSGDRAGSNSSNEAENLPPSIGVQRTCGNCRFFFDYADRSNRGECRRAAPRLVDVILSDAVWPKPANFEWCGEWEESHG